MSIRDSFNSAAERYDGVRRVLIPCFDDFYGTAVDLLGEPDGRPLRILDLGAGTGLLAAAIRRRFPAAVLTLLDVAEDMLSVARQRFAGDGNVDFRVADYGAGDLGGPYDAVVSALSIHHLEHPAKRALFGRAFAALAPGGRFVNADQAQGPTPALDARYDATWVRQVHAGGVNEADFAAARRRQAFDRMAPLADQLRWLDEAGFAEVDCVFKSWSFVVYTGVRPA
ncbi:tRNA (cmo5U34)-methyltransferase [Azospirillum agricola]|uniref:class I SAM-dependent methyltransferase n=1 Tax=Azospirillum agricola TaxID=1720247 RepID=UPI002D7E5DA3|nr:methyltransferase domain-containing protein [Azospirillum agricola]MBP2230699.1 tRNA (cmo5U34)-methyltransferase [Azospirillum agricola]